MELKCTCGRLAEGGSPTATEKKMAERSIYTAEECHMILDLFEDTFDECTKEVYGDRPNA